MAVDRVISSQEKIAKYDQHERELILASVQYLRGEISLDKYNEVIEKLPRLDLRKLAAELNWH